MTILDEIVDKKRDTVKVLYQNESISSYKDKLSRLNLQPSKFKEALSQKGLSLISEIKKASPSKGIIRKEFDVLDIANGFVANGASAFSILTDEPYFMGKNEYLIDVNNKFSLPILRKDFIIDELQLYESKHIGADAILLIVEILSVDEAQKFINTAKELQMDVLIEVHSDEDVIKLKQLQGCEIIGINNRNLKDFSVDLTRSIRYKNELIQHFPDALFVAESGYSSAKELVELEENMFNAVLIGEGLAVAKDLITYFKG